MMTALNINDFSSGIYGLWHHKIVRIGDNNISFNNIVFAVIFVFLGIKYYGKFSSAFKKRVESIFTDDINMGHAIAKIGTLAISALYWILVLQVANIPLSIFAFIGGALAIGVGLGTKNIINNLVGSFMIIIEKPIKIGDLVSINGNVGKVTDIYGLRSVITTQNNIDLLIPNNILFQNILVNYTLNDSYVLLYCTLKISRFDNNQVYVETEEVNKALIRSIKRLKTEKKEFAFKSIDIFLFGVLKKEYNYQMIYSFCIKDFIDIHKVKNAINIILSEELPKINTEFEIIHENISNQFSISEKPEKIEDI
jgi:small-conductance mechanosensitive channel